MGKNKDIPPWKRMNSRIKYNFIFHVCRFSTIFVSIVHIVHSVRYEQHHHDLSPGHLAFVWLRMCVCVAIVTIVVHSYFEAICCQENNSQWIRKGDNRNFCLCKVLQRLTQMNAIDFFLFFLWFCDIFSDFAVRTQHTGAHTHTLFFVFLCVSIMCQRRVCKGRGLSCFFSELQSSCCLPIKWHKWNTYITY